MFKIIFTLFILSGFTYSSEIKQHYAQKVDPNQKIDISKNSSTNFYPQTPKKLHRKEIGRTWYDYAWNNQSGRTMVHDSLGGIHFVFMKLQPNITGIREVVYNYWNDSLGIFYGNQTIIPNIRTGWARVVNGKHNEPLVVLHGDGMHLWQGPPINNLITLISNRGYFPGIARKGDTILVLSQTANAGWMGGDTVLISTDYLQNWAGRNILNLDPQTTDFGCAELWPTINPTNTNEFSFLIAPDITANEPEGSIWLVTSPDLGQSYTKTMISKDDSIFGATQYIIENYAQMNGMYTKDGNYHAVFGSVQGIADTASSTMIDMFPILYWNKNDREFITLTDNFHTSPPDSEILTKLVNARPGNGLGNAYAQLSEGPNGDLIVIWQQWEDDGQGGMVTQTPAGGIETYMTDIYGAYSPDGGETWSEPFYIAGESVESDIFPNITGEFFWNSTSDSIYLDIMYMWDSYPLIGPPDPSEVVWYYERVIIPENILISGINQKIKLAEKYNLYQNYPNPFNPTTTIKYELPKNAQVKIEIFDILGQRVKTLVNSRQNRGEHTIVWDGLNSAGKVVSSGIYLYSLQTENFVKTKKMLLLR
jgi:hypothetical protein